MKLGDVFSKLGQVDLQSLLFYYGIVGITIFLLAMMVWLLSFIWSESPMLSILTAVFITSALALVFGSDI